MKIFIDTSFLVALNNTKDPLFEKAKSLAKLYYTSKHDFYTSNLILFETATILSMRVNRQVAISAINTINNSDWTFLKLNEDIEQGGWSIFRKTSWKDVGFVDCTSFYIIDKYKIDKAFTFDNDFRKYKIEILN